MNNNLRIFLALIFLASTFISCSKNSNENLQELGVAIPNTSSSGDSNSLTSGLFVISGNNQVGAPAQTFTEALKVQYLESGQPVAGKEVYFNLYSGASVSFSQPSTVVTDSAGMASVYVTAGAGAGVAQIRATSMAETVDFSLTILSQSGNNISVSSGNNQLSKVGTNVANPLRVMVVDSFSGVPKTGILVRFEVLTGNGRINSSTNIVDVTSDASGVASVFFQTGTLAGDSTVRASIVSDPAQNVVFTATGTVAAGDEDLAQSEVSAASASLSADGASLVLLTMIAKDQYGNQIPAGGKTVTFTPTLGTLVGTVTDVGDGTYTQFLRAPSSIAGGPISIGATIDAAPLTSNNATVNLISGSVDLAQSEVVVSNPNINANGSSTSLVTVVLKDSLGNQLSAGGETVVISTANGTLLGSVVDNGDGTYSQMLQSTTSAQQNISLTATVGGSPVGNSGSINFNPGPADLSQSTITASDSVIAPDGVATTTVTVVLKDINGNSLLGSAGSVVLSTTAGTLIGSVIDNADGSYQQSLRSSAAPGTATITGTLTGNGFSDTATVYFSSAGSGPSPVYSSVDIIGNNFLAANGSDTTTIKVTLKDNQNNQLSNGGSGVTISTSAGSMIGTITDNNDGTYTQVLRSSSTPTKNVVVSVVVDGVNFNDTEIVQFYGPLSLATSTMSANPSAIEATGSTTSLVVLQAKDVNGVNIPVGGETIVLSTDQGTLLGSLVDNNNGTYTQVLQSVASAQIATVSATSSGSPLSDTAAVEFFVANNEAGNSYNCSNINTINNKALVVDGGELVLDTWDCEADAVFTNIILRNNASITHSVTGSGATEYGLKITADSINIDASSSIHAHAKGYLSSVTHQFRVPGPQHVSATGGYGGGSHGGRGGHAKDDNSNQTYGNPFQPQHMGASGGACWNTTGSMHGGGRIKLVVTGDLVVNGSVNANAWTQNVGGSYRCGGAGGSVWIDAQSLIGTGSISANGGGDLSNSANYRYGGGGGRVAVYAHTFAQDFALTNIKGNITAYGFATPMEYDGADDDGAAGTVFWKDKDELYGSMIIDNNGSITTSTTEINVPSPTNPSVITANSFTVVSAFTDTYDSTNPYVGYFVDPKIDQNATGTKFDNTFYEITSGTANAINVTGSDLTAIGSLSDQFEIFIPLNNLEITGNAELVSNANILVTKGDITSDDDFTAIVDGTPTSKIDYYGGNVSIDMTDSTQPFYGDYGLDKYYSDITFKGIPSLNISSTFKAKNVTLDSVAVVSEVARGTNLFDITGTLRLQNASSITQKQTEISEGGTEYSIEVSAGGLYLEAGSSLSAIGKGYFANVNYSCRAVGNTHSKTSSNLDYYTVGGSHGGIGGYYEASTLGTRYDPMPSYGSFYEPKTSGGSCRYSQANTGRGGGIIYLDISGGPVVIDGSISVDAIDGCMGAAGGSVYIKGAAVGGSGTISANGSNGNCGNVYAGGAGGRVAIHYDSLYGNFSLPSNIISNISAFGGTYTGTRSSVSREASAGTIFIKKNSEQFGDMIINNNGQDGYGLYGGTFINIPVASTSVSLSSTTLTNAGSYSELGFDTGFIKGLALNPNTAQNGTENINDDILFSISEAIGPTISVQSGDMTSIASSGDNIEFALVLKNIQISGKAQLKSNGKVLIKNGDLLSNNTTTLVANGGIIYTDHVEYGGVTDLSFIDGTYHIYKTINITNFSADNTDITSFIKRKNLTINASGNISLTNGAEITAEAAPTTIGEEIYSVELTAANITVDASSKIDVTGKGYNQAYGTNRMCRVVGNKEVLSADNNLLTHLGGGASYGGWGSAHKNNSTTSSNANTPYGSFSNPYEGGASCKYDNTNATGRGGGVIRLNASSTLTLNGQLVSNGDLYYGTGSYYKSGTGGSIYVNTSTLTGTGSISANSLNAYAPGSGGRIAIHYDSLASGFAYPNAIINAITAFGGETTITDPDHSSAGTIYLKDKAKSYGDLIINNNNITYKSPSKVNRGAYIKIPSEAMSVSSLTATSALISTAATEHGEQTGFFEGLTLNPNIAQNATSTYADDTLFPILSSSGSTLTTTSDLTSVASNADNARLMLVLNNLQIINQGRIDFQGPTFVREGDLTSGDTTTFTLSGGGLDFGPAFEFLNLGNLNLSSVTLLNAPPIVSGSNLTIADSYIETSNVNITGDLTLDNSEVIISGDPSIPNVVATGDISLTNGSSLTHPRTYVGESDKKLYITANNLTIDGSSSIDLVGKGYDSAGATYEVVGPGAISYPNKAGSWSTSVRAATHAGDGSYSGHTEPYGSFVKPVELGSAMSYVSGGNVRAGGGAVRIEVANILDIDGTIDAAGEPGGYGGSGGSVWITTNTLDGSGSVSVNGSGISQGGGGGRIAVYFTTGLNNFAYPNSISGSLSALGGGQGSNWGAAGTIYLKQPSQTYGDLIINNAGNTSPAHAMTRFVIPSLTASSSITSTSLNAASIFGYETVQYAFNNYPIDNRFQGYCVRPDVNENGTATLTDDTFFVVNSSVDTQLLLNGDPSGVANGGDTFRLALCLDNLEVAGKGKLDITGGDIYVLEGDLSNNDTTTFNQNGTINADTVDVGAASWTTGPSAAGTINTQCAGNIGC